MDPFLLICNHLLYPSSNLNDRHDLYCILTNDLTNYYSSRYYDHYIYMWFYLYFPSNFYYWLSVHIYHQASLHSLLSHEQYQYHFYFSSQLKHYQKFISSYIYTLFKDSFIKLLIIFYYFIYTFYILHLQISSTIVFSNKNKRYSQYRQTFFLFHHHINYPHC